MDMGYELLPEYIETARRIRTEFGKGDAVRDSGLKRPDTVEWENDISYGPHGKWNLLDIYYPKGTHGILPTIISIHGGAWMYGTKEVYQFYGCSLAERGFAFVNFNYRLAPEHPFPAAIEDINSVFAWVKEHGREHHIDTGNLFVVGDSAGAQMCSQYMAMRTDDSFMEAYAAAGYEMKIPKLFIRAVALNCGIYDMTEHADPEREAYYPAYFNGDPKRFEPLVDTMAHLTEKFPPTFVMSAYHDFLYKKAEPMTQALKAAGVEAECHIYGSMEREDIGHVFHCNMKLAEAHKCNDDECAFFRKYVRVG